MNEYEKFEVRAYVFHRMVGMLAPGKDAREGPSREERVEAWEKWNKEYGKVVSITLDAIEYFEI